MALLSTAQIIPAGLSMSLQTIAAGGDTFVNPDRRTVLIVRSTTATPATITVTPSNPPPNLTLANYTYVVTGGGSGVRFILGPFPPEWFNDANGRVAFSCTDTTNVAVRVARL
jgi:hypothetical protein